MKDFSDTDWPRQRLNHCLPPAWKLIQNKRLKNGWCDHARKTIRIPPVADLYALAVFLHEIGHATLHKAERGIRHVEEYEAERFSFYALRGFGYSVTRQILAEAKGNVRGRILEDERRKVCINPKIKKWSMP